VREAQWRAAEDRPGAAKLLALGDGTPEGIEGAHVTAAAHEGDPVALAAFGSVARWLGQGLADLAAVLDPAVSSSAVVSPRPAQRCSTRCGRPTPSCSPARGIGRSPRSARPSWATPPASWGRRPGPTRGAGVSLAIGIDIGGTKVAAGVSTSPAGCSTGGAPRRRARR